MGGGEASGRIAEGGVKEQNKRKEPTAQLRKHSDFVPHAITAEEWEVDIQAHRPTSSRN